MGSREIFGNVLSAAIGAGVIAAFGWLAGLGEMKAEIKSLSSANAELKGRVAKLEAMPTGDQIRAKACADTAATISKLLLSNEVTKADTLRGQMTDLGCHR